MLAAFATAHTKAKRSSGPTSHRMQVGGAHWLSENLPTSVDVAAAEQQDDRVEGSIGCTVTFTSEF